MDLSEVIYLISIVFAIGSIFVLYAQIKSEQLFLLTHLAFYLFVLAVSNLMLVMLNTGWMIYTPHLYKLFMPLSLLSPVAGYWYVRGSLGGRYVPKGWDFLHLLPFILVVIHYVPFYFMPTQEKLAIVEEAIKNSQSIVSRTYGWIFSETQVYLIRTVQAAVYIYFSFRYIRWSTTNAKLDLTSKRARTIVSWIKFFVRMILIYFISIIICYFILSFRYQGYYLNEIAEQIIFVITACFVFAISSYLLLHPKALLSLEKPIDRIVINETDTTLEKYTELILANNWHLDQSLTLPQLLEKLSMKSSDLSSLIKMGGYSHFNDYINSLRLITFIDRATDQELEKNSIEGVALSCGFKSPSTFYRVFRDKYNCTPKQYLAKKQ